MIVACSFPSLHYLRLDRVQVLDSSVQLPAIKLNPNHFAVQSSQFVAVCQQDASDDQIFSAVHEYGTLSWIVPFRGRRKSLNTSYVC